MITSPATHPVKRFLINTKNMLRYFRDPLAYMTWMQRTYGRMSATTVGKVTMFAFFTPEAVRAVLVDHAHSFTTRENSEPLRALIGDGLFTLDGELHKWHRHLLLPAFHRERIEGYRDTMVEYTQRLLERWKPGEQVDMLGEMQRLTMRVAAKTLFNVEINECTEELGRAFTTALERANETVEIDGTKVSAGDVIWLSQWVMHRIPEYFPDPETFMPERFEPQHGMKHPQFAFFPFGGGARRCLGMTFAYEEMRIVLAMLLQRYSPVLVGGFPVMPRPLITLRPKGGMWMRIEEAILPAAIKGEKEEQLRAWHSLVKRLCWSLEGDLV